MELPEPPSLRSTASKRRKTVAVLLDYMSFTSGAYEALVREAFHARATELDLDLLLVYGRPLTSNDAQGAAHNAIFDLIHSSSVDGAVVVSTCLTAPNGEPALRRLMKRLAPLPMCSIGVPLDGVPTVLIDNRKALAPVIRHLIEDHGKRRIAFVAGTPGNPEAQARFLAYREVLSDHGIEYDDTLVGCGYFLKWGGRSAMDEILARRPDLDAVVSANDGMAVGIIESLRHAGYHVPRDVAVTGFDDLVLARLGNPPITTVVQPVPGIAAAALDLLLKVIDGKPIEPVVTVPTQVIRRRSCGCDPNWSRALESERRAIDVTPHGELGDVQQRLDASVRDASGKMPAHAETLVRALVLELSGNHGAFQRALDDLMEAVGVDLERCRAVQDVVTRMRVSLRPANSPELEDLWFSALYRIGVALAGTQVAHQLELDSRYLQLITAGERVSVALDMDSLRRTLAQALPALGVETGVVSLFEGAEKGELRALVAIRSGSVLVDDAPFPATSLFPTGTYDDDRRHTSAVFPLTQDAELLGIALFDYRSGRYGYPTLRDNICAALRSIRLHTELLEKSRQHERSVQEKHATARRIESLSVLAGGVAHDLNNSLGPLVALPDVILRELEQLTEHPAIVEHAKDDIRSIQTAALRAVQTIKDLLTLGRQGRVPKDPIDLSRAVANAVLHGGARGTASARVSIEAAREALSVLASEAHLIRAVSNLVQNAVESSLGGNVVIKTSRVSLAEPLNGYETVEPGEYGVVSVTDDGLGIGAEHLPRIFEPFFSTKVVGEQSGSGLGLAIVHSVVKEHSGFVDVQSVKGQGTTFSLYLPLATNTRPSDAASTVARGGDARLLVLDDDPVQRRTAHRILSHLGYQVEVVSTGQEAYDRCFQPSNDGKIPFDLLIFDVVLNERVDGLELCERIRERAPGQRALLVSGHAQTKRLERAVQSGLRWLAKPYTATGLAAAVDQALNGPTSR
jgi:phosphoserine phosphatase RsbU/P